jgi:hypothetical protein
MASKHDEFISNEVAPLLGEGEQIQHMAYMVKQPGLLWQLLLLGGLLLFLMTKAYYVAVTTKKIVIIRTKQGFAKPALQNLGVEEIPLANIKDVTTSGFANNRSMTFHKTDGSKLTLRIAPWSKIVTGNKAMLEQFPGEFKERKQIAG